MAKKNINMLLQGRNILKRELYPLCLQVFPLAYLGFPAYVHLFFMAKAAYILGLWDWQPWCFLFMDLCWDFIAFLKKIEISYIVKSVQ